MASFTSAGQSGRRDGGGPRSSPRHGPPDHASPDHDPLSRELRPPGPVELHLDVREEAEVNVLSVGGELDVLTAPRLGARLDELMRHTTGDLVVDLQDTAFIDSSGLHILLNTARRMSRQSRGFAVICRPGPVMRVIERARLTDALRVVSDLSEYERHAP